MTSIIPGLIAIYFPTPLTQIVLETLGVKKMIHRIVSFQILLTFCVQTRAKVLFHNCHIGSKYNYFLVKFMLILIQFALIHNVSFKTKLETPTVGMQ